MQNFWPDTLTSGTTSQPARRRRWLRGPCRKPQTESSHCLNSLTLKVELLDRVPRGFILALVVGQCGVLEYHPVLAVALQGQLPGPGGSRKLVKQGLPAFPLLHSLQAGPTLNRKIRRWSLSSGMVVRLS